MVPDGTLKAICKTVQGCWAELVNKGMAPKTWGKANTSMKEVVFLSMYKSFPFLQLAENDWKINLLCSLNYPGWVHNNLDDKGKWVGSCHVKQEDDAATGDQPAGSVSRKCYEHCYFSLLTSSFFSFEPLPSALCLNTASIFHAVHDSFTLTHQINFLPIYRHSLLISALLPFYGYAHPYL